jgi:hypothetical protein
MRRFAVQHLVSGPHLEADIVRAQLQQPCIRTDLSSAAFHAEVVLGFSRLRVSRVRQGARSASKSI